MFKIGSLCNLIVPQSSQVVPRTSNHESLSEMKIKDALSSWILSTIYVIIKSSTWAKNFPRILQRDSRSKFPALLPRPSSKCYIFEMEHIKLICFRQVSFSWDPSPIIYLPCKSLWRSLLFFNFAQIVGFVKVVRRISLKLLHGFVKIDTWISLSCYMDLSILIYGFRSLLCLVSLSLF